MADFLGGLMARRVSVLVVIVISQTAGLVVIALAVALVGESAPDAGFIPYAAAAGVSGACGLAAFYRGLAVGKMSIVAPISSMAVVVPVVVGIATGDRPSAVQAAGAALGIFGIVLASRESVEHQDADRRVAAGVGFALLSAIGIGGFFVAMDVAADSDPLWASFVNRMTSLSFIVLVALLVRPTFRALGRGGVPMLLSLGVLEMIANVAFAFAATEGLLSLTSVLSSLYPLVVVFLSWLVLDERLERGQKAGVAFALAGVALIAGG